MLSCKLVYGHIIFVFYPEDVKEGLPRMFRIENVTIPPNAVFTGHGYPQLVGGDWQENTAYGIVCT